MSMQHVLHALVLHLYQPPDNLRRLLHTDETELLRILKCYERIARHAHKYAEIARFNIVFSIPLVEQLTDPQLSTDTRHLEEIPAIIKAFRSATNIEFIASGYQHAPLPLIPEQDWDDQLRKEREMMESIFGHTPRIYYPPAGLFNKEMIPALSAAGYKSVLLPRNLLVDEADKPVDPYRCYSLDYNSHTITAVPIDDGFSHAQAHGMEAPWFADELNNGIAQSHPSNSPYLITTFSDGENGDWFRRLDEENGFFGHFFAPYVEFCETGEFPCRPTSLMQYIDKTHPQKARLATPTEQSTSDQALALLANISEQYRQLSEENGMPDANIRELILRAEGSCYLLATDRKPLLDLLHHIQRQLNSHKPAKTTIKTGNKKSTASNKPSQSKHNPAVISQKTSSAKRRRTGKSAPSKRDL